VYLGNAGLVNHYLIFILTWHDSKLIASFDFVCKALISELP